VEKVKAAERARVVIAENKRAFEEFDMQRRKVKPNQLLPMLYGLYHGYDASFVRFAGYKPGQWREQFKRQQGHYPDGIFPYCGVIGLQASKRRNELAEIYQTA
jgi:hypothetical protein